MNQLSSRYSSQPLGILHWRLSQSAMRIIGFNSKNTKKKEKTKRDARRGIFNVWDALEKRKLRITSNISRTARLMRLRGWFEAQCKGNYAICIKNKKKKK